MLISRHSRQMVIPFDTQPLTANHSMGITVHYRGQIDDLAAIETLEDRVIDLVLAFGGQVQIWRSAADDDPQRIVRGLLVELDPGQEALSLLFSPEGFLIPLTNIEDAERSPLAEPPLCFVKTQFGSVEGHAALVETLSELKSQFLPSLEVHDEGGYWEHRDPRQLADAIRQNARMIDAVASGLEEYPLSREAAEDVEIVAARVQRVAETVHRAMQNPVEPAADRDDGSEEFTANGLENEATWDRLCRLSTARTLRMERDIEEQLQSGRSVEEALESAWASMAGDRDERGDELAEDAIASEEPWEAEADDDSFTDLATLSRDPLLERATQLFFKVAQQARTMPESTSDPQLAHAGELCGGLAQILPLPPAYEMDPDDRGLAAVQLKRSLRGAAFLRGALYNQRDPEATKPLLDELETIEGEIVDHLKNVRQL